MGQSQRIKTRKVLSVDEEENPESPGYDICAPGGNYQHKTAELQWDGKSKIILISFATESTLLGMS